MSDDHGSSDSRTPPDVFVSYSRDDRRRAVPIIELIENAGFTVWWDGLLGGGERFSRTTHDALEGARSVVVLWSETSVASHWVHDEATRGRDRGCLIPVSIDGVRPPLGFGQFQTIDLSRARLKPGDPAVEDLLRALAACQDRPLPPPARAAERRRGVDRRLVLGGGAALAVAGAGAAWWGGLFERGRSPNSVAVLPFVNLSGDPAQAYFSDGVAAEIRSELARNPLLQVAAQASSARFAERRDDARTIVRKLRVAHLLDGNVRKSGNLVRVAVELTEGATGFSKWSQTFDRPLANLFAVQEEIARAVAAALSAELAKGSEPGKANGGTANIAAYDSYLRGSELYRLETGEESARAALARFDEAIARDSSYGAAWAARSRAQAAIANQYLDGAERAAMFGAAIESANRALRLAPDLADSHSALGYATFFGKRDAKAARAPFERSARLGRGESDVLTRYALYCARVGRFDAARAAIARAALLDPLNPLAERSVGTVEFTARHYADAIAAYGRALALNPEMSGAHAGIGFCRLMLGELDPAAASFDEEPSALRRLSGVAMVARRRGRGAEAEKAFAQVVKDFGDSALYEQAQILAQWGDLPRAFATLTKAAASGDPGLVLIRTDPLIDPLRKEPGFSDLLKQAGFA
jgi:TolB-like protein/Tfp pilus assembly protein PilF